MNMNMNLNRILELSEMEIFDFLNAYSQNKLKQEIIELSKRENINKVMIAGQSVVSAISRLAGFNIESPINDIDIFIEKNNVSDNLIIASNKKVNETVLFSKITHDIDYGVIFKKESRYKILESVKKGILNITRYHSYSVLRLKDLLSVFDINSTKAGMNIYLNSDGNIDDIELVILPEVFDFFEQKLLKLDRFYTPVHSIIRILRKGEEFGSDALRDEEREIILPNMLAIENLFSELTYSERIFRNADLLMIANNNQEELRSLKEELSFIRKPMFFGEKTLKKFEANKNEILKYAYLLKRDYKESLYDSFSIDLKGNKIYTMPNAFANKKELKDINLWTLIHKDYQNVAFNEIKETIESLKKYNLGFIGNAIIDFIDLYLNKNDNLIKIMESVLSRNYYSSSDFLKNIGYVFERFSNIYVQYKRNAIKNQKKKHFFVRDIVSKLPLREESTKDREKNLLKNYQKAFFNEDVVSVDVDNFDVLKFYPFEDFNSILNMAVNREMDNNIIKNDVKQLKYVNITYLMTEKNYNDYLKILKSPLVKLVKKDKLEFFKLMLLKNSNKVLYSQRNLNLFIKTINDLPIINEKISDNVVKINALSSEFCNNTERMNFIFNMSDTFIKLSAKETFEENEIIKYIPIGTYNSGLIYDENKKFLFHNPLNFFKALSKPLYYFNDNEGKTIGFGFDGDSLFTERLDKEEDLVSLELNEKIAIIFEEKNVKYIPEDFKVYYFSNKEEFDFFHEENRSIWWWEEELRSNKKNKDEKGRKVIKVSSSDEEADIPF